MIQRLRSALGRFVPRCQVDLVALTNWQAPEDRDVLRTITSSPGPGVQKPAKRRRLRQSATAAHAVGFDPAVDLAALAAEVSGEGAHVAAELRERGRELLPRWRRSLR